MGEGIAYNKHHYTHVHPFSTIALNKALRVLGEKNDTLEFINYGGQGLIYRMYSQKFQKYIAIKVPHYASRSSDKYRSLRRNIRKEGNILAILNKNSTKTVPQLYFYDIEDGEYLIREYIDGKVLSNIISTLEYNKRERYVVELTSAAIDLFTSLHNNDNKSYVLRDFKSNNIIISNNKKWKIIDFGSVRSEEKMCSNKVNKIFYRVGTGKWLHWPPEQLLEIKRLCDRRIDFFAYGVLCYHILVNKLPYSNTQKQYDKVLSKFLLEYSDAIKLIDRYYNSAVLPKKLLDFIKQCLHPDASNRPSKFPDHVQSWIYYIKSSI